MKRKKRFITSFDKDSKELFLSRCAKAKDGLKDNPDFLAAPVKYPDFELAYNNMVAAAPSAVRKDIDGLRVFQPLREIMEGYMSSYGTFGQSVIGDNPARMEASGLPLTKEPVARSTDINIEVANVKVKRGETAGSISISGKPNPAAEGLVIFYRTPTKTYVENIRVVGFKVTLKDFPVDEVVVLQVAYWNNEGTGPMLGKGIAILV